MLLSDGQLYIRIKGSKSNTEPIIRIITEAKEKVKAEELSQRYFDEIKKLFY